MSLRVFPHIKRSNVLTTRKSTFIVFLWKSPKDKRDLHVKFSLASQLSISIKLLFFYIRFMTLTVYSLCTLNLKTLSYYIFISVECILENNTKYIQIFYIDKIEVELSFENCINYLKTISSLLSCGKDKKTVVSKSYKIVSLSGDPR